MSKKSKIELSHVLDDRPKVGTVKKIKNKNKKIEKIELDQNYTKF